MYIEIDLTGGAPSQSTTASGAASHAIDGNLNMEHGSSVCTQTG